MDKDEEGKSYYQELEEQFQYSLISNHGASEEQCWKLAKMSIEERYAIRIAWTRAVEHLHTTTRAPGPADLKILHEVSFHGFLNPDWFSFRDSIPAALPANDDQTQKLTDIEQRLHTAATQCGNFLITKTKKR